MAVQVPLAGSYSSALVRDAADINPPATSTMPLGSKVAVCQRACGVEAARGRPGPTRRVVQFRAPEHCRCYQPPATSTMPLGSKVAV